jgi:hypothetical protein
VAQQIVVLAASVQKRDIVKAACCKVGSSRLATA